MKNPEETIGKLIDNASTSFVSYVDEAGFPVTKAMQNQESAMEFGRFGFRRILPPIR